MIVVVQRKIHRVGGRCRALAVVAEEAWPLSPLALDGAYGLRQSSWSYFSNNLNTHFSNSNFPLQNPLIASTNAFFF